MVDGTDDGPGTAADGRAGFSQFAGDAPMPVDVSEAYEEGGEGRNGRRDRRSPDVGRSPRRP